MCLEESVLYRTKSENINAGSRLSERLVNAHTSSHLKVQTTARQSDSTPLPYV